jgi:hypothetical protein
MCYRFERWRRPAGASLASTWGVRIGGAAQGKRRVLASGLEQRVEHLDEPAFLAEQHMKNSSFVSSAVA